MPDPTPLLIDRDTMRLVSAFTEISSARRRISLGQGLYNMLDAADTVLSDICDGYEIGLALTKLNNRFVTFYPADMFKTMIQTSPALVRSPLVLTEEQTTLADLIRRKAAACKMIEKETPLEVVIGAAIRITYDLRQLCTNKDCGLATRPLYNTERVHPRGIEHINL